MPDYHIVIYDMNKPNTTITVAIRPNMTQARLVMRLFAGKGWDINRRPDVHTFGSIVMRAIPATSVTKE